ncbi:MAG: spermidine/putrescine ABC transporter ATP-binding protein PotA [Gammaproteobacteria bacterium]|nr:spermidine/putrescine ABC transporter ATP-binding protein PotA [Gammaproteobacteria bacterium]
MPTAIVCLQNISKRFADQVALYAINLEIYNGEFLTLLGPSGCGKTTLLRLLAGFLKPDSGQIIINQTDVTMVPPEDRHVNLVFQSYALFPHMSVFDNVAFGLRCHHHTQAEIKTRVEAMLARVKLSEFTHRKPHQLSGGQQQRVAIARAAINKPSVLLLDEPLSALDYHLRRNMRIELKRLQRSLGMTFVLVTHDQEEALSMSDRVVVMHDGRIEQIGTPRDVYEEPKNMYVAKFIGDTNIFSTTVKRIENQQLIVDIANQEIGFNNKQAFKPDEKINIILRPEDITVWGHKEINNTENALPGKVLEVIYKGSTVDLIVELSDGHKISATEFFDEDDDELIYEIGENVWIEWQSGWEVILTHE